MHIIIGNKFWCCFRNTKLTFLTSLTTKCSVLAGPNFCNRTGNKAEVSQATTTTTTSTTTTETTTAAATTTTAVKGGV